MVVVARRLGRVLTRPWVRISQIMTRGRARTGWILKMVAVARRMVPVRYRCFASVNAARARIG